MRLPDLQDILDELLQHNATLRDLGLDTEQVGSSGISLHCHLSCICTISALPSGRHRQPETP